MKLIFYRHYMKMKIIINERHAKSDKKEDMNRIKKRKEDRGRMDNTCFFSTRNKQKL